MWRIVGGLVVRGPNADMARDPRWGRSPDADLALGLDADPSIMDYNIRDGETYLYFKGKPLYPLGFGLSYTTFAYSHLNAPSSIAPGQTKTVRVRAKDTGHSRTSD